MDQDSAIRSLLSATRTVAMVGLSPDEEKPSNVVARYLKSKGFRVIPVNPGRDSILGEKSYRSVSDIPEKIGVVDIFMRAERVVPIVEEAIQLEPKAIWLQLGMRSDEAKALAEKSGIMFVMDKCMKQEYARLLSTP
jgi:predicted CoA-binding protein